MKRFIFNVALACVVGMGFLMLGVVVYLAFWQPKSDAKFRVPDNVSVVCIGNSHTGCTWYEDSAFSNRVLWTSSTGLLTHYMRFREFERLGQLDHVKVCIIDCDGPAMNGFSRDRIKSNFYTTLPFSWRYVRDLPIGIVELLGAFHVNMPTGYLLDEIPPDDVPNWTTRTETEKQSNILNQYGASVKGWDSEEYFSKDWQQHYLNIVSDIQNRCRQRGIRLIMFAGPLSSESPARTNITMWNRETELIERIKALGVEYYDFRLDCPDTLFRDSHHLLKSASYEFTRKFFSEKLGIGSVSTP